VPYTLPLLWARCTVLHCSLRHSPPAMHDLFNALYWLPYSGHCLLMVHCTIHCPAPVSVRPSRLFSVVFPARSIHLLAFTALCTAPFPLHCPVRISSLFTVLFTDLYSLTSIHSPFYCHILPAHSFSLYSLPLPSALFTAFLQWAVNTSSAYRKVRLLPPPPTSRPGPDTLTVAPSDNKTPRI
jgi:hypothetical protein